MAKKYGKKSYVGKVMKGKEGKPDYIVVDMDFDLKKGDFLRLESKKQRLDDLAAAFEAGRLDEAKYEELAEKAQKSSDNVRFTIIHQEISEG